MVNSYKENNEPVIYLQEVHRKPGNDMGRELDGNKPDSHFHGTDIPYILHSLNVLPNDTLIICGTTTNMCVHYTGAAAHQRDYHTLIIEDCHVGNWREEYEVALTQLNYLQRGTKMKTEEFHPLLEELNACVTS